MSYKASKWLSDLGIGAVLCLERSVEPDAEGVEEVKQTLEKGSLDFWVP